MLDSDSPVLLTQYRGDGGLALAGEGLMDILMLTDHQFLTRDMATPITVEAIVPTTIGTVIYKLL